MIDNVMDYKQARFVLVSATNHRLASFCEKALEILAQDQNLPIKKTVSIIATLSCR